MSEIKVLLALSFVAILVHQFEEYRWPGYFAGLFNVVIFNSDIPDRYPLNTQSAMVINILIAYVFYLLPVFFQNIRCVGSIKNKGRYILDMINMYRPFTSCFTIAPRLPNKTKLDISESNLQTYRQMIVRIEQFLHS